MLKTATIVVVALVALLLLYAATRPDTFRVERSVSIKAPPEKIFPLINDYQNWKTWSPYEKLDPAMKRTFSGPAAGKGAVYAWDSNSHAGVGRMEILDTSPPSKVAIKLDFTKPFEAHNLVAFTLEPQGDSTTVKWAMDGPVPYFAKIVHLFLNMDRLIGTDFESGLANLKAVAEK